VVVGTWTKSGKSTRKMPAIQKGEIEGARHKQKGKKKTNCKPPELKKRSLPTGRKATSRRNLRKRKKTGHDVLRETLREKKGMRSVDSTTNLWRGKAPSWAQRKGGTNPTRWGAPSRGNNGFQVPNEQFPAGFLKKEG